MAEQRHGIAFDRGGDGDDLLVLIHGLAATAGVWSRLTDGFGGRWLALDLPGHGGSAATGRYTIADHADAVVGQIRDVAAGGRVTLLGHSLGGAVALALADPAYGLSLAGAYGLGIKIDWSDEELARFAALAERPLRRFATRDEALAHYRRAIGLREVPLDSPMLARGVVADGDAWRTAMDPAAYAVTAPPVAACVARAVCPVRLACGAGDPMVGVARLRDFDRHAVAIDGAGHNAMVDDPAAVLAWLERT